ncbi:MAG: gamma-glutamylcyclotransferase [Acidobacteriota bacterium]
MWIFGYGSLIWRPDFDWVESAPAAIEGWERRFWQGSPDHRGMPHSPGRVVTLIEAPSSRCWGVAYRLSSAATEDGTLDDLDDREKAGYRRLELPLHLNDGRSVRGLCYVAAEGNENFLGEASLRQMAQHILDSVGPSGSNVEYLLELATALRRIGAEDQHVFRLEEQVRRVLEASERQGDGQSGS